MAIDIEIIVSGVAILTPVYALLHKLTLQQKENSQNIEHILLIIDGCKVCKTSVAEHLVSEIIE